MNLVMATATNWNQVAWGVLAGDATFYVVEMSLAIFEIGPAPAPVLFMTALVAMMFDAFPFIFRICRRSVWIGSGLMEVAHFERDRFTRQLMLLGEPLYDGQKFLF